MKEFCKHCDDCLLIIWFVLDSHAHRSIVCALLTRPCDRFPHTVQMRVYSFHTWCSNQFYNCMPLQLQCKRFLRALRSRVLFSEYVNIWGISTHVVVPNLFSWELHVRGFCAEQNLVTILFFEQSNATALSALNLQPHFPDTSMGKISTILAGTIAFAWHITVPYTPRS